MKIKGLIASVLLVTFTGCASIVGQSSFPVTINSNPSGANISIRDERGVDIFAGVTPATISLTAGESYFHAKVYDLTFTKAGYAPQHSILKADIDGWYFGNILLGGLIGMLIIDPITGKMWKLPLHETVNLYQQTSLNNDKKVLQIATLDQVPQEMRKEMVSLN